MRDWRATAAVFAPGNDTAHREQELKCLPGLGVGSGLLVEACSYVKVERKARKGYHACPRVDILDCLGPAEIKLDSTEPLLAQSYKEQLRRTGRVPIKIWYG